VKKWRFEPARKSDKSVAVETMFTTATPPVQIASVSKHALGQ